MQVPCSEKDASAKSTPDQEPPHELTPLMRGDRTDCEEGQKTEDRPPDGELECFEMLGRKFGPGVLEHALDIMALLDIAEQNRQHACCAWGPVLGEGQDEGLRVNRHRHTSPSCLG